MITSARYKNNLLGEKSSIEAVINDKTWIVPLDEENADYQAILQWVADGNTIEEAD